MKNFWVLDEERRPKQVDMIEWAKSHPPSEWRVAESFTDKVRISTVFLSVDHRHFGSRGPPILFETMVFELGSGNDLDCVRYSSWDDAEAGHATMLRRYLKQEGAPELP